MRGVKTKFPIIAVGALAVAAVSVSYAYYFRTRERFSPGGGGCVAIVEPRKHPRFKETLDLFLARVPGDWSLYVFCGTDNESFARDAAKSWIESGRTVEIANLGVANLSADLYNKLFKTKQFWQRFREETVLVVQTDAVPCASSPIDIGHFAEKGFGYIGCAYGNRVGKNTYWDDHSFYGVGGLSLRRKSFALKVCDAFPPGTAPEAEDVAFSDGVDLFASEYPKPTASDLIDFCAQNASRPGRSWGAHQIGRQLPDSEKRAFYEYCPAAREI
jgi:hypothetical protein